MCVCGHPASRPQYNVQVQVRKETRNRKREEVTDDLIHPAHIPTICKRPCSKLSSPPPQPTDKGMQQASSCVRSHFSLLQPGKAVIPMLLMLERLTYLTSHRYTTTTYASKKIFTPNNFISSPTHLPKACAVSTTPTYLPTYPSLTPKKKNLSYYSKSCKTPFHQTKPNHS